MCKHCGKPSSSTVRMIRNTDIIVRRKKDHESGKEGLFMESGLKKHRLPKHIANRSKTPWQFKYAVVCDPNVGCGRILRGEVARV